MYLYYLTNSFVFSTNLTRFSVFLQCLDKSCAIRAEVFIIISIHFSLMLTLKSVSLVLLALTSLSCSSDDTRELKLNMAGIHWTQGVWRSRPTELKMVPDGLWQVWRVAGDLRRQCFQGEDYFGLLVRLCPQAPFCTFRSYWCGNKNKRQLIGFYQSRTKPRLMQHWKHTWQLHVNLLSSRVYQ